VGTYRLPIREKLKAVASRRASSSRPFGTYVGGRKEEDEQRLEALLHANEVKRAEVQMKINRAVGVGWLCEEYIELVSCTWIQLVFDSLI